MAEGTSWEMDGSNFRVVESRGRLAFSDGPPGPLCTPVPDLTNACQPARN